MSMTYSEWVSALGNIFVVDTADAQFLAILPRAIEYAEGRIYRELDLLKTYQSTSPVTCTPNAPSLTLPSDTIVVMGINIITPASTAPDAGTRNQLMETTRDYLDAVYNSVSSAGVPQYFAMLDNLTVRLGPWPSAAYQAEVKRTYRPEALSSTNTTTILTTYIPDVFLAASCVFLSGYQRDFGAQSDDPQRAMSWEQTYKTLSASAAVEQFRAKSQSASWTPVMPTPVATPQRG